MWNILAKFCEGQLETCAGLLREIEDHVRLDVYLSPHVNTLYEMIMGRLLKKRDRKTMTDVVKKKHSSS